MNNNLLDCIDIYKQAGTAYSAVASDLERLPDWLLDEVVGDDGAGHMERLVFKQGLYTVGEYGKPPTIFEWLDIGYYNLSYMDDTQKQINDYISDLEEYVDIMGDMDILDYYNMSLIASYGISNGLSVNAYDTPYGINNHVALGFSFKDSELYKLKYASNGDAYVMLGDMKLYMYEFIRI